MSVTRIPIDGLWRCLCPSIDLISSLIPSRRLRRGFHNGSSAAGDRSLGSETKIRKIKDRLQVSYRLPSLNNVPAEEVVSRKEYARMQWENRVRWARTRREGAAMILPRVKGKEKGENDERIAKAVRGLDIPRANETFSGTSTIPPIVEGKGTGKAERVVRPVDAFAGMSRIPPRGGFVSKAEKEGKENTIPGGVVGEESRDGRKRESVKPISTFEGGSAIPPRRRVRDFTEEMHIGVNRSAKDGLGSLTIPLGRDLDESTKTDTGVTTSAQDDEESSAILPLQYLNEPTKETETHIASFVGHEEKEVASLVVETLSKRALKSAPTIPAIESKARFWNFFGFGDADVVTPKKDEMVKDVQQGADAKVEASRTMTPITAADEESFVPSRKDDSRPSQVPEQSDHSESTAEGGDAQALLDSVAETEVSRAIPPTTTVESPALVRPRPSSQFERKYGSEASQISEQVIHSGSIEARSDPRALPDSKLIPIPNSDSFQRTAIPPRQASPSVKSMVKEHYSAFRDNHVHPTSTSQQVESRKTEDHSSLEGGLHPKHRTDFDDIPLVHLHDQLAKLIKTKDGYFRICELVTYLLEDRGEKPSLVHYDALIRANAVAEYGGADVVKHLLQEMKELGIGADNGLYHGVLQVLAIHPDYLLREQILQEMKMKWFGLSPEGWHNYVVGLLRDRQYEVAIDKLEQMHTDNIMVQPWLYDIFMFQLCDAGELDEVFKLLKHRFENDRKEIQPSVWYYVLDAFTKAFHYEGTKYIWKRRIQTNFLVPSDGICTVALNMAARYADPGFATSIVRILSSRLSVLAPYHYEALLAAYAGSGDMKTAFRILAIMSKAKLEPDTNTTRPLFIQLSQSNINPLVAWEDLKSLSKDGHVIPVTAANVVLEACCETNQFEHAITFYKELHEIIETGPNTDTFNTLLQGAVYAGRKDLCMFFASEMAALDIKADRLTYDRLILACLPDPDYEDAFRYLEEMTLVGKDKGDGGWWMRAGTARAMVERCSAAGDERAWGILKMMMKRGMRAPETWVKDNWGKEISGRGIGMKLKERAPGLV